MRVAFVTTSYPLKSDVISGVFVGRLVSSLSGRAEMHVVTPASTKSKGHNVTTGIKVTCFRYAPRAMQLLAHLPGGIPVAMSRRPWLWFLVPGMLISMFVACIRAAARTDLMHANWVVCGCVGGLAAAAAGKPTVTTLRGEDVTRARRSRVNMLMLRLCTVLSKRIVCVSVEMADWLVEHIPESASRLVVIENGVGDEFLAVGESRQVDGSEAPLRFVTVGSLIRRKRVADTIVAFAAATMERDAELVIVGAGPEADALEALAAQYGVSDRISFVGAVTPERIPSLLSSCDVLVLASESEGRPNVVVEAMAAGLAIIATDIPGVRELVVDGVVGQLFPVGNVSALRKCMEDMQNDPPRRIALGTRARASIIERGLTWECCSEKYVALYRAIVKERT